MVRQHHESAIGKPTRRVQGLRMAYRRARKPLAQPPLPDGLLLCVCRFLRAEGKSAREIVTSPGFRLWGQAPEEIGTRLVRLSWAGAIRFEWSGDIAVLDLGEETLEAYTRRLGQEAH